VRRLLSQQTPAPHPDQLDLALETENEAIENAPPAPAPKAQGGSRKGRKVRAALWPEHLPVEETILVPLCVQQAPEQWREIARDVSGRLERLPARLIRQQLVRPVYQYKDEPHRPPVQAPVPPNIIEGGSLGVQLMAGLVLDSRAERDSLCAAQPAGQPRRRLANTFTTSLSTVRRKSSNGKAA
jgi:hypothetical protein